jgi:hypothetical protein
MRKLTLSLDAPQAESFHATDALAARGTVASHDLVVQRLVQQDLPAVVFPPEQSS